MNLALEVTRAGKENRGNAHATEPLNQLEPLLKKLTY